MEPWISRSNLLKQTLAGAACTIVGLVLAIGFRHFSHLRSDQGAGFMLGILLCVIGVAGLVTARSQTVTVDPRTRRIIVEDSSAFGRKQRVIPFNDIQRIAVGYLGKKSNGVTWYYLVLKLASGRDYSLFAPGRFYPGGNSRATVEGWRQRLEACLSSSGSTTSAAIR